MIDCQKVTSIIPTLQPLPTVPIKIIEKELAQNRDSLVRISRFASQTIDGTTNINLKLCIIKKNQNFI